MRISDEIRELAGEAGIYSNACGKLRELADRIDNEMIELPKDADGEPIRVGDTVCYCNSCLPMKVLSLSFDGQWHLTTNKAYIHGMSLVTHERPDSFERISDELKTCGETKRNAGYPDVDGRERYEVRGIQTEDIIAEVMRNAATCGLGMAACWDVGNATKYLLRLGRKDDKESELGKAENYLHHALTGEWIGEGNDED